MLTVYKKLVKVNIFFAALSVKPNTILYVSYRSHRMGITECAGKEAAGDHFFRGMECAGNENGV